MAKGKGCVAKRRRLEKRSVQWRRSMRRKLIERDGDTCCHCGLPLGDDISLEHRTPLSRGGSNGTDNLALAHRLCNERADGANV